MVSFYLFILSNCRERIQYLQKRYFRFVEIPSDYQKIPEFLKYSLITLMLRKDQDP